MSALKVGDVCVWQNCAGLWAWLNGTETTIMGEMRPGFDCIYGTIGEGYVTDTPDPFLPGKCLLGEVGELRLKQPPSADESESRQAMLDCIERAMRGCEVPA